MRPFQKFRARQDIKLIFYVKGKDEVMKVEIMKETDKVFYVSIPAMTCDKKLGVTKQFHTVPFAAF